jgi:serine/threonine protein kinase
MDPPRNPGPLATSEPPTLRDADLDAELASTVPNEKDDDDTIKRGEASGFAMLEPSDPFVGVLIDGRYKVERTLGAGGMGVVYRARHKVIDKPVAIKVLRAQLAADQGLVQRFLNEARAASRIGNPHIVDVSDFGTMENGATYFVMELADGDSLAQRITARGALSARDVVSIARQIAEGLHAAHQAGIVHRDLKPDNVMLVKHGAQTDFVKILDFGIAKVNSQTRKLTAAGDVFGTPQFMSPEQANGSEVDHRTDIYALGVIMFEMSTGRLPFDGENTELLKQHLYKAPPAPRSLRSDVPSALEKIILKCLAKKPQDRYAAMNELVRALDATGLASAAPLVAAAATTKPTMSRVAIAIAALFVLAGIGVLVAALSVAKKKDVEPSALPTMSIPLAQMPSSTVPVSTEPSVSATPSASQPATVASVAASSLVAPKPHASPAPKASAKCPQGQYPLFGECQGY